MLHLLLLKVLHIWGKTPLTCVISRVIIFLMELLFFSCKFDVMPRRSQNTCRLWGSIQNVCRVCMPYLANTTFLTWLFKWSTEKAVRKLCAFEMSFMSPSIAWLILPFWLHISNVHGKRSREVVCIRKGHDGPLGVRKCHSADRALGMCQGQHNKQHSHYQGMKGLPDIELFHFCYLI